MDVFEASEQLVEEELVVFLREGLLTLDDLSEICIHHLRDNVYVLELFPRFGEDNSLDVDDVFVL
jgi:hypothetical protein